MKETGSLGGDLIVAVTDCGLNGGLDSSNLDWMLRLKGGNIVGLLLSKMFLVVPAVLAQVYFSSGLALLQCIHGYFHLFRTSRFLWYLASSSGTS
jgi:hypothetical protein